MSLTADQEDTEAARLWVAEVICRRDEVRSGQVIPIPGEEVLVEVRHMVAQT